MAVRYRFMVATGQYKDQNGETKTRWSECGAVFEKRGGGFGAKITMLPTAVIDLDGNPKPWDGWLQMFGVDENSEGRRSGGTQPQKKATEQPAFEDDIPF